MQESMWPSPHNPLRLTTAFASQYPGGVPQVDDLGDACFGEVWRLETCARITTCLTVVGGANGGGAWRIAVPMQWASNYRFEVYLRDPSPICRDALPEEHRLPAGWHGAFAPDLAWWAP